MGIGITISGLSSLQRKLRNITEIVQDGKTILTDVKNSLVESVEANFNSGGPPGQKWPKIARYTSQSRKHREGYYGKVAGNGTRALVWSGGLKQSFSGSGRYSVFKISSSGTKFELRFGSTHPLAKMLSEGATFSRGSFANRRRRGRRRALAFFNRNGRLIFSRSSDSATITIPPRPIWSAEQEDGALEDAKEKLVLKVRKAWN